MESKVVVAGAGFILNNEMDDFSIKPGVPTCMAPPGMIRMPIAPRQKDAEQHGRRQLF